MNELPTKVNEPPIGDDVWESDKLERKPCAETLTQLLHGQEAPLTISLNGEWGSGKTFLLKRWQVDLRKKGCHAVYFNAWEDDCLVDPLVAIIGQISHAFSHENFLKTVVEDVKAKFIPFLKHGLNHFVDSSIGVDLVGTVEASRKPVEIVLDEYEKSLDAREELKKTLANFAKKVFEETKHPVVFILDELDRCRPTFAIETLERIKHFFNINHMVFVLGIDREQLGKSIQSVYGDIDVENYLHRFIDLDFLLPQAQEIKFVEVMWERYHFEEYLSKKTKESGNQNNHLSEGQWFRQLLEAVVLMHQFTLREIEQIFKLFAIAQRFCEKGSYLYPCVLLVLIILKLRNKKLYDKYVHLNCTVVEVCDFIIPIEKLLETQNLLGQIDYAHQLDAINHLEASIYTVYENNRDDEHKRDEIKKLIKEIRTENSIRTTSLRSQHLLYLQNNNRLSDFLYAFDRYDYNSSGYHVRNIRYIAKKIDFIMGN